MGFFLLGRGRDTGDLRLISSELYSNRADALDALTFMSGEPTFEHRDAEVFVLDLDSGVPILLVSTPAAPVAAIVEATPDEAPAEDEAETTPDDAPVEEPVDDTAHDAGVWEAPSEVVDDTPAEEPEGTGLAGALKRATGALESEGIVAPDSIGPAAIEENSELPSVLDQPWLAETDEEDDPSTPEVPITQAEPEAAWPWDTAADKGTEPVAAAVFEAEAESEPEPEPIIEAEPEPVIEAEAEPEAPAVPVEPVLEVPAYVPDPFEEPASDPDDFLKLISTDDSSSAGRTVVMGAYADESAPESVDEAPLPAALVDDDNEIDSILADLGPVETPALTAEAAVEPLAAGSPTDGLTCDDCVYVNTCPNQEGLDPATCGNFQWKTA
ncbi:MAG: hypothetical protein Q8K89_03850 [Actinomycetota bacterium]|nr:hypothetical protein [Actinomycetota bacterium]